MAPNTDPVSMYHSRIASKPKIANRNGSVEDTGSGRDSFITWNRGGRNKDYHAPGMHLETFENNLRGTVRYKMPRERDRVQKITTMGRRYRNRKPLSLPDVTHGKKTVKISGDDVASLLKHADLRSEADTSAKPPEAQEEQEQLYSQEY